jgi:penicillin-binding protein 1A
MIQGSVVVLQNRDGRILAETGGRKVFKGRPASYSDYNRVTESLRQPGSAMKPMVYLAAFRHGGFTLETFVPDEPIGVSDGGSRPLKWISNYDGRFKGLIPIRQALAESRNAVAMWITEQIGIDSVLRTSRSLGVRTPLARYPTTALGASEMNLLELANAYRTMASGIVAEPYVIRAVVRHSREVAAAARRGPLPASIDAAALSLIQEGLRGVVRLPTGTAHALASRGFPIAVMGKTGTTNEFRDAIFVGSTYGPDGITAAVRIGFDDNRSLGSRETGARLALPVFQEVMLGVYRDKIVGAPPAFPAPMEARITASLLLPAFLLPNLLPPATDAAGDAVAYVFSARHRRASPAETDWLLQNGITVRTPIDAPFPRLGPGRRVF